MINTVRDQLNSATQRLAPQAFPTPEPFPPEIANYDGYWGYGCAVTPPPDLSNLLYGFQRQKCSPNISYEWTGHAYTELWVNQDVTMCAEARSEFCNLIRLGLAAPTVPLGFTNAYDLALNGPGCSVVTGDDMRVAALIVEADRIGLPSGASGQQPFYWRCVPTAASENGPLPGTLRPVGNDLGQCVFIPPIQRLISNPDSLEVVFWETDEDWSNAARAAFWAAQGGVALLNSLGQTAAEAQLQGEISGAFCNYQRGDAHLRGFARPFTVFAADNLMCPTIPPRCSDDSDCIEGDCVGPYWFGPEQYKICSPPQANTPKPKCG
jgi:hypothetical protein